MAADANIFQQFLRPVRSVQDYSNDLDAAEGNKLALAAARLKGQQDQQSIADDQTYRTAAQQAGGDQNALVKALMGRGLVKQAQAIQTGMLDTEAKRGTIAKTKMELEKGGIDLEESKRLASLKRAIAFNSPQDAILDIQTRLNNGEFTQEQADQHLGGIPQDQAGFDMWQLNLTKKLLSPEKRVEMVTPKPVEVSDNQTKFFRDMNPGSPTYGKVVDGTTMQIQATPGEVLNDKRSREEGDKNRGVTMRGQNMTDVRAKETNRIAAENKQDKPMTDSQSKAALFGTRMQQANKILDSLAESGTTTSVPGIDAGYGVGSVVNTMASKNQQQLAQAKRDFINAVLRRESGAVIGASEFASGDKQYFPQIGDSKEVIAQKKANRETAMRGILAEVPESRRAEIVGQISGDSRPEGEWGGSSNSKKPVPKTLSGYKYLGVVQD